MVVQSVECGGRCLSLGFKGISVPLSPNSCETFLCYVKGTDTQKDPTFLVFTWRKKDHSTHYE